MRHLSKSVLADAKLSTDVYPSILILQTPNLEEIARAIWQRQHDTLGRDSIAYNTGWRDPSLPAKYWNEYLEDARAVLSLFYSKHVSYENIAAATPNAGSLPECG